MGDEESEAIEALHAWFGSLAVVRGLGLRLVELGPGRAVAEHHVLEHQRNPGGSVNGGYLLAVADVTAGAAVSSSSPSTIETVTTDLSMHFLAAAVDGPLIVEAEVVRRGGRSCVPSVRITDAQGVLCAIATGTWSVRAPR